jgi:hypothetical protein
MSLHLLPPRGYTCRLQGITRADSRDCKKRHTYIGISTQGVPQGYRRVTSGLSQGSKDKGKRQFAV